MHIFHIANYYTGSKVYKNLVSELDKEGVRQTIYTAFIDKTLLNANISELTHKDSKFSYRPILNLYSRINYFYKKNRLLKDVLQCLEPDSVDLIHAHTVFSDGAVALGLKKRLGIPYIVAVRSTDVSVFFRRLFYVRNIGIEVLKEAQAIIFLNPDLRDELVEKYIPTALQQTILSKSTCVPNGISHFWQAHQPEPKQERRPGSCNILYVGTFLQRKNVPLVLEVANWLAPKLDVTVTIVGGGGKDTDRILKLVKEYEKKFSIKLAGKISDPEQLKEYYREADIFIMLSKNETFGLVYVESLSQGTPVVYTSDTGISGYFENGEIGYGISDFSLPNIGEKIGLILKDYKKLSANAIDVSKKFNWRLIAKQYISLYNSAKQNN